MKIPVPTFLILCSLSVACAEAANSASRSDSGMSSPAGSNAGMPATIQVDESSRVKSQNGIRYLDGGIGADERAEFAKMRPMFNARLQFTAGKDREYVAAVGVRVLDSAGNVVFNLPQAGPWLWLDLPAGRYTVDATWDGRTEHHVIRVGTLLHAKSMFNWHAANVISPKSMLGMG